MTYTEDREVFERDLFKPPHLARMLERAGQYTGALCKEDRELVLKLALDNFWELRGQIRNSNDVLRVYDRALAQAVRTRPKWRVWWGLIEWRWIKSVQMGKGV